MKGERVEQFKVGERVQFTTNFGDHKSPIRVEEFGKIAKLHKAGRQGVAEIFPEDGGKKISRRLQCVTKIQGE